MIAAFRTDLERALSPDRLNAYQSTGDDHIDTIASYFWNVALCQSLYPTLGALEVCLRNSIHQVLTSHFGRDDWYEVSGFLQSRDAKSVLSAKQQIRNAGKSVIPGRVVAALGFGFWTSLLSALYGNSPKGPQIWAGPNNPLLASAFPNAPLSIRPYRSRIHRRFDQLRHVRNRVSHHEPIWAGIRLPSGQSGVPGPLASLIDVHSDTVDAIGWINPSFRDAVTILDTFPDVHTNGHLSIRVSFQSWFSMP